MIGHQHVSMNCTTFAKGDLIEISQVASIIVGREEARLTVVPALSHELNRGQSGPPPFSDRLAEEMRSRSPRSGHERP